MNCPKCGSPVNKNNEYCGSRGCCLTDNEGASGRQKLHKKVWNSDFGSYPRNSGHCVYCSYGFKRIPSQKN